MTRREAVDRPWSPPRPLDELNSAADESDPWVSPDGTEIYFTISATDSQLIYRAKR